MKVLAFNGSPRKQWNTATLLNKALEGASSQGADTELIHLYDLDFKGCISCFACKTKDGPSYGECGMKDALTTVLKEIRDADALLLGSPIYFGNVTGEMRSFLERLMFPYLSYTDVPEKLFPGKINVGCIYTMNIPEVAARQFSYDKLISHHEGALKRISGREVEHLYSFDTYQFSDYSKVVASRFDPEQKARRRAEVFPEDCRKAFELGARLAG